MTTLSDEEREAQIRKDIGDPSPSNPAWKPNQYHASDIAFLLRRLNEARAERDETKGERNAYMDSHEVAQEEAARLRGEVDDLKHDIERALASISGEAAEVDRLTADIAALRAPPGADAIVLAQRALKEATHAGTGQVTCISLEPLARALEQHALAKLEACARHIEGGGWGMSTVGEAIRAFGRRKPG